jgi:hypothetical protein
LSSRCFDSARRRRCRGALILGVAAGYVKVARDRIEKNPDHRVREALQLVFARLAEFQCARQVHIWLRDEGIELPVKSRDGGARGIVWRLPAYNIVHNILTNPIYAGAYAFGRTTSKVSVEQGRKRVRRGVHRPMAEWDVLIKDHHAGYITWEEFERNQGVIANNATGKASAAVKGAVRRGELLLPGLLRCGHCGRKLHVSYSGKLGRYNCYGARTNHGSARCISISGLSIDGAVGGEVLHILKPLGIEAAVKAIETQTNRKSVAQRQLELSLQQARYEAAHARRQYDAVDPANRLVAAELELQCGRCAGGDKSEAPSLGRQRRGCGCAGIPQLAARSMSARRQGLARGTVGSADALGPRVVLKFLAGSAVRRLAPSTISLAEVAAA